MASVTNMPLPIRCHTVDDVLAAAKQQNYDNIIVCSETDNGFVVLHAGKDGPLTAAQIVWTLEGSKLMVIQPGNEMGDLPHAG